MSWDKLKISLVKVVIEEVILNSVEVGVEVPVELSLIFLVWGDWWGPRQKMVICYPQGRDMLRMLRQWSLIGL